MRDQAGKSAADSFRQDLTVVINGIMKNYIALISELPMDDPRQIAASHLAGRAALQHLQELLRFTDQLDVLTEGAYAVSAKIDVQELLRQAQEAMAGEDADDQPFKDG